MVCALTCAVAGWLRGRQSRCAAMKLYLDAGRENAGRRGIFGGHAHLCFPRTWGEILILVLVLSLCLVRISVQRLHGGVSWGARWRGTLPRDQRRRRRRRGWLWRW